MTMRILVLNGPALKETVSKHEISEICEPFIAAVECEIDFHQSIDSKDLSNALAMSAPNYDALVYCVHREDRNNDGFHATANQLAGIGKRIVELHLENPMRRAVFENLPLKIPNGNIGLIAGFGKDGFRLALQSLLGSAGRPVRSKPSTIGIFNGPNLNLLGTREPEIYGTDTLDDVERRCADIAAATGLLMDFRQSNHEGEIVDWIQAAIGKADGLIINAGAYTHTSIAIHDALKAYDGKITELHISNPHVREEFRHTSFVANAADYVVAGLGVSGYEIALQAMAESLS